MSGQKIKLHFKSADPLLYPYFKNTSFDDWIRPINSDQEMFERLTRAIIGQQLSTKAARTIHSRYLNMFSNKPTLKSVSTKSEDELRSVGISRAKISYIKSIADHIGSKTLSYKKLAKLEDEAAISELIKIKGVGQWTAEMFVMFSLGREDIFSVGDAGLRRAMRNIYALSERTPDTDYIKLSDRWAPYRTYACIALWESLE